MTIRILYFGALADISGKPHEAVNLDVVSLDTEQLKDLLFDKYPELSQKKFKIAINQQIITGNEVIPASADVALLPPFAGG